MGFFGGESDNPEQDRADELMTQQIEQSQAELEQKRENLATQRLAIIHGEGAQTWSANRNAAYSGGIFQQKPLELTDAFKQIREGEFQEYAQKHSKSS